MINKNNLIAAQQILKEEFDKLDLGKIKLCSSMLSNEINNNRDIFGKGIIEARLLGEAQGNLKVLIQRLEKKENNSNNPKVKCNSNVIQT